MRRLALLLVALLAWSLLPAASTAGATPDPAAVEQAFVDHINGLRAGKALAPLTVDPELTAVARRWAAKMAAADAISHNPRLADEVAANWQKLGENVGVGMQVDSLHEAFVRSPAHYRNLVDPDFTTIGVGVVLGRDGAIFTAHEFMRLRSSAASAPPTTSRAHPTRTGTPEVAAVTLAAVPSARMVLVLHQLRLLDAK